MALNKQEFQTKLKEAAGKMKAAGRSNEEIQSFIDRKKDEYRAKYGEGKPAEVETTDAAASPEATASSSEPGLSESDQQLEQLKHKVAAQAAGAVAGIPPVLVDKVAALTSGTADFVGKLFKVPSQLTYTAIETGLSLFDPEAVDTKEERMALKSMIEHSSAQAMGLTNAADKLEGVAEDFRYATKQHDKTIGQQFAQGEIGAAIDQTLQQALFSAPSVAAAFTGAGGLAVIGGSAFGGKFEEEFENDPMQSAAKLFFVSGASAGIEIVSESVTAGIAGRAKALLGKSGKEAAKQYVEGTLKYLAKEANLEGASEALATVANKYLDQLSFGREVDLKDLLMEAVDSYIVGATIGGGIAGVGAAGRPSGEKAIVDAKTQPDSLKENNNKNKDDLNNLNKIKTEENARTIEEIENDINEEIIDDNLGHSEIVDNIPEEDLQQSLYIDGRLNEIGAILEDPNIDDASRKVLEDEALSLKQEKEGVYEEAAAKTNNTTGLLNTINEIVPLGSVPEDVATEVAVKKEQAKKKLDEKLKEESLPDTPVSPTTRKEIERGNVVLEGDGEGNFYYAPVKKREGSYFSGGDTIHGEGVTYTGKGPLQKGESAFGAGTPLVQRNLEQIHELETAIEYIEKSREIGKKIDLKSITIRKEARADGIYAIDKKTGQEIKIQLPKGIVAPTRQKDLFDKNWGRLVDTSNLAIRETGYPVDVRNRAAVGAANSLIDNSFSAVGPTKASSDNAILGEALSQYDLLRSWVKTAGQFKNAVETTEGRKIPISDQHRVLSGVLNQYNDIVNTNKNIIDTEAKLKQEREATPTTNEQGQVTGGPDPVKIEQFEQELDALNAELDTALTNLPQDLPIPSTPDLDAYRGPATTLKSKKKREAINKVLEKLDPNVDAKQIAKLKKELSKLDEAAINSLSRYKKDLAGKLVSKFKKKDINDFLKGKISPAEMVVKGNNIVQAAAYNFYGSNSTDAIQEANLAAIEALSDPKVVKSIKDGERQISGAIYNAVKYRMRNFKTQSKIIPVGLNETKILNKIRPVREHLMQKLERMPTYKELSDALNEGVEVIQFGNVPGDILTGLGRSGEVAKFEPKEGKKVTTAKKRLVKAAKGDNVTPENLELIESAVFINNALNDPTVVPYF